ncbi:methyltransferase domain-containing protein [Prochlorococcus sp. AH-736-K09]|nr:methyltransferase domain-containing protein [Prochlorococcus sp. AH-736-K09]
MFVKEIFLRRYYINKFLEKFDKETKVAILEIGSGEKWKVFKNSKTLNRDSSAKPDIIADAEAIELESNSFDIVVCIEVLEHTQSPQKVVQNIHRILKNNGQFICSVPFSFEIHDREDYWRFTEKGILKLLNNFSEVKVYSNGGKFSVIFHFLRLSKFLNPFYFIFNNIGFLLDKIFEKNPPRITLGYCIEAKK